MTSIAHQKLAELITGLKPGATLQALFYGYTIKIEELSGSHLLRSMLLHPSAGEKLRDVLLDAAAVCKDGGAKLHGGCNESRALLGEAKSLFC